MAFEKALWARESPKYKEKEEKEEKAEERSVEWGKTNKYGKKTCKKCRLLHKKVGGQKMLHYQSFHD